MLPSTAITRLDLSATFAEFDLAASRKNFIGPRVLRPFLVGVQAADVGKLPIERGKSFLYIYDGRTGDVVLQTGRSSSTYLEFPTVADVDDDA